MPGKSTLAGTLLLLVIIPALVAVAGAQGSGSLTRGGIFTVTVEGLPRTAYYIWLKGTSSMSGEPGDQPPVIVPGQVDVVQDPPGGPYTIGSYPIHGAGGLTILDDVAPFSSVVPATSYYAQVRTDASGYGVVMFQTSQDTATDREFHIVAENPADPGEEVSVFLGLPARAPVTTAPLPPVTTAPPAPLPSTPVPEITLPAQSVSGTTPAPPQTTAAAGTPGEKTPFRGIPLPVTISIAATGIGLLARGLREKKHGREQDHLP